MRRYGAREMTREKAIALLFNGIIAFGLNVVSFSANKKTGVSSALLAGVSVVGLGLELMYCGICGVVWM